MCMHVFASFPLEGQACARLSDSMRATVTPLADVMDRQVVAGREAQTQLLDIVRQLKVVTLDDQDDSKP